MNEFVVAIPSYKRAEEQGTLEYVTSMGFPTDDIYIFVQTESDYEEYKKKYSGKAEIVYAPASGVAQARNNILEYFSGSKNILMCDDDIRHIGRLREKLEPIKTLDEFNTTINRCFQNAERYKGFLFGVYPIYNDFYMTQSVTFNTTVNTVLGFPKGFSLRFDETFTAKEDIELCGRILNAGGNILRYDFLAVEAKHRTNDGGCKEIWNSEEHEQTVKRLCLKYPNVFAPQKRKPNEVRVKSKSRKVYL